MTKVEKSYSGQTLRGFQAVNHLANAPWRQQPKNSLEQVENHQPFYIDLCANLNHLLDKKKKSHKISSSSAKLEQFFIVLFVILKCNSNLSILINRYFQNFNWHLHVLINQKEIQYQCLHSKLFPGFRDCSTFTIRSHTVQ